MSGFRFCPICGEGLIDRESGGVVRPTCPNCGFVHYDNPAPTAGVLVLEDDKVLLVKRRYEPYQGLWVIPSGYIERGEGPAETAVREMEEETGLKVSLGGVHSVEPCFDDPRGDTVFIVYRGEIEGGGIKPGDDAEEARFFSLKELPEIAFDAQKRLLGELKKDRGY